MSDFDHGFIPQVDALPARFRQRMVASASGRAWLAAMPERLTTLAVRWQVRLLPPFSDLSYNYAAPVVAADGTQLVLKTGAPEPERHSELAALKLWRGIGIVALRDSDPTDASMLLEHVRPGLQLADRLTPDSGQIEDDEATRVIAVLLGQLPTVSPTDVEQADDGEQILRVEDWLAGLHPDGISPFAVAVIPPPLLATARRYAREQLAEPERRLVHGDLHHHNVVSDQTGALGWRLIDPKGVLATREYECAAMLRNPIPRQAAGALTPELVARRVAVLAETTGFDRQRIAAWGVAQTVLSARWSLGGPVPEPGYRVAEGILRQLDLAANLIPLVG